MGGQEWTEADDRTKARQTSSEALLREATTMGGCAHGRVRRLQGHSRL